jgi:hypothetical protein
MRRAFHRQQGGHARLFGIEPAPGCSLVVPASNTRDDLMIHHRQGRAIRAAAAVERFAKDRIQLGADRSFAVLLVHCHL